MLFLALLLACKPEGTSDTGDTDATTASCPDALGVTIGTGSFSLEPLAEGDAVTVVHGPQGGWHIWVGGLVTGTDATWLTALPTVVAADGTQLAGEQEPQSFMPTYDGCDAAFYGVYAYLDDYTPADVPLQQMICALDGQPLTLSVTVTDETTGQTATDTIGVVASRDPYDDALCP